MLYQKKRRKINLNLNNNKKNQDSTQNSDRNGSTERNSSLSESKKKSSTKFFNKRLTRNKDVTQKDSSLEKINQVTIESQMFQQKMMSQTASNYFQADKNTNQQLSSQKEIQKQKLMHCSNTQSTCSLQLNNNVDQLGHGANKKKFKLFCQVKKKKQNEKKSQYGKETENFGSSSTVSESWIKNSIFSRNSQKNGSNSTKKNCKDPKEKSLKRKINLNDKIRQIRSKEKYQLQVENGDQLVQKIVDSEFKNKDNITKISSKSSKESKQSLQKKHPTLNLKKRSLILSNLTNQKKQKMSKLQNSQTSSIEYVQQKQTQDMKNKSIFEVVQNKILPEDSQIVVQSVKKLSEIKEECNQNTISRSIKNTFTNSIDHSSQKNADQNSIHLSVNSIYRDIRRSYGYILETTESRESNLRKQIQSSLSEIQKSRQKINIQKFKEPKTIGQMGSQISNVQRNMTTIQKIEFHIEIINTLSNFVYKSTELEYLMEDWDELNFLIYKKFYIQRMKVLNFLKKYPIRNPFCIKRASIETKEVLKTLKQNEAQIKRIKNNLQVENSTIKKNLEVFFNQFSKEKHGEKINLFEYDNFSHWIYKELWDQIQLFSYSQSHSQHQLEDRICKSLQTGFLISQLNNNFVTPFEDAEIASHQNRQKIYIDDNIKIFQRYVLNKKK